MADKDKYPEFTNLRSDEPLKESVSNINIENPTDKAAVDIIFQQKGLTAAQRKWMNSLISRSGVTFVFKEQK
jgi:hypothetical protein